MELDDVIKRLDELNTRAWIILAVEVVVIGFLMYADWKVGICVVLLLGAESRGKRIAEEANAIREKLMARDI